MTIRKILFSGLAAIALSTAAASAQEAGGITLGALARDLYVK